MKRHLTLQLKRLHPDYSIRTPKDLEKRLESHLKIIGEVAVGKKLELYFEDGFIFKTATLDIEGFINHYNKDNELRNITLCTKDMAYEFDIVDKPLKLKIEEQMRLEL